jgi:hypothetical protein
MLNNFASSHISTPVAVIIGIVLLAVLIFEIAMLISVILNKKIKDDIKVFWILGMLVLHPFVALFYYFTKYKK